MAGLAALLAGLAALFGAAFFVAALLVALAAFFVAALALAGAAAAAPII